MTSASLPVLSRSRGWIVWSLLGVVLLALAYPLMMTTFMFYDDEGYVLISLRNFIDGAPLYTEVFSQYGPWPYLYHLAIATILQSPITHSLGRALTIGHWLVCSLGVGAITSRLEGRRVGDVSFASLLAALASFAVLWHMASEPSHPGSLLSMQLTLGALLAVYAVQTARWKLLGISVGLIGALCLLTKINVGAFFIIAVGAFALRTSPWPGRLQPWTTGAAHAGLVLLPWLLMAPKLDDPRIAAFAGQVSLAAAALGWLIPERALRRDIPRVTWGWALATLTIISGLIGAVMMARGTPMRGLVHGVLLDPLRHPTHLVIGLRTPTGYWFGAALVVAVLARVGWEHRRRGQLSVGTAGLLVVLRLGFPLFCVLHTFAWASPAAENLWRSFVPLLLAIALLPLGRRDSATSSPVELPPARVLLAFLALLQVLHAYPVGGSQVGWGTFLALALLVPAAVEAVQWIAVRWRPGALLGGLLMLSPVVWPLTDIARSGWTAYVRSAPLNLPGAENIRLDDKSRLIARTIYLNAGLNADMLFSRPGMFSQNLWTEVPTPTRQNATHWFWLLDETAQQKIIDRLRQAERPAYLSNRQLDAYVNDLGISTAGRLESYLTDQFKLLFDLNGFDYWVRQDADRVTINCVSLFVSNDDSAPVLWRAVLALEGTPTELILAHCDQPITAAMTLSDPAIKIRLTPVNPRGEALGPSTPFPAANPLQGLYQLEVMAPSPRQRADYNDLRLLLRDADGNLLAEALFE